MTIPTRPGFSSIHLAVVLIAVGLMGEMSPGFSHDFPGGGWTFITAGAAALAAGVVGKRSPKAARLILLAGFCLAGLVLMRGCASAPHR